jgi:hypothetical protein
MSNFTKRSINNKCSTSSTVKKFCKVCHDAGKPEAEYTSHYVRSSTTSDGVVVCPTLLALNCRYCGENGHTVKFCKELEKKKKAEERGIKRASFEKSDKKPAPAAAPVSAGKNVSAFAALDSDSEDEQPLHKSEAKVAANPQAFSYAAMASKPAAPIVIEKHAAVSPSIQLPVYEEEFYEDNDSYQSPPPVYKSNWAPDSYLDADTDDEEEEYRRPVGKPAPWSKDYKESNW